MNDVQRMKELAGRLKEAAKAYYAQDREIMSNYEYDRLYDELEELERKTGVVLAGSPTVSVGYEAVDELLGSLGSKQGVTWKLIDTACSILEEQQEEQRWRRK